MTLLLTIEPKNPDLPWKHVPLHSSRANGPICL